MNKGVALLLGITGLATTGGVGGHYYLANQTEQVYQATLEGLNQQFANSGLPIKAEKMSFDGKIALTRISLSKGLGDMEWVVKQEITAGPLLNTANGMQPPCVRLVVTPKIVTI